MFVAFDPEGEIAAHDRRRPRSRVAFDPTGEITATDARGTRGARASRGARDARDARGTLGARGRSRPEAVDGGAVSLRSDAAGRAALAESFAAAFGLDDSGPTADALADRYGLRYEAADGDPDLPAGRRTVTITGRGAERAVAPAERSIGRSAARYGGAGHRVGPDRFRSDRIAMWAVALALLLAFIAATSAHAAGATLALVH